MNQARGASLAFVAACFLVALFALTNAGVSVWDRSLIAPVALALVHLGAVLAGREWATMAVVVVNVSVTNN